MQRHYLVVAITEILIPAEDKVSWRQKLTKSIESGCEAEAEEEQKKKGGQEAQCPSSVQCHRYGLAVSQSRGNVLVMDAQCCIYVSVKCCGRWDG